MPAYAQVIIPAPGGYYTDASKTTFVSTAAPEPKLLDDALSDRALAVGESVETTFSALLLIPEGELGEPIYDYGDEVKDPWKPRTFDEWIRARLTAPTLERLMNEEYARRGETTRVEIDRCDVLSTRPAASERPQLKGTGVGIQRADLRVRVRVTHNAIPLVTALLLILAGAIAGAVTAAVVGGAKLEELAETGGRSVGKAVGGVVAGIGSALLPLGLLAVLLLRRT